MKNSADSKTASAYVVSKFYRVPCVWIDNFIGHKSVWVPVIGPMHDDLEHINFNPRHWHIDWRFAQEKLIPNFLVDPYARVVCKDLYGGRTHQAQTKGPEMMRRKMRREWPAYPFDKVAKAWLPNLCEAYKNHRMKGMVCPHRGIPLEGCPRDGDVVTCPGHGLRWNIKTGEMVRSSPSATDSER